MEFRNTLSALHTYSQEISRLLEQVQASDKMHTIEIDILLAKLRDMYDIVSDMRNGYQEQGRVEHAIIDSKEENPEPETVEPEFDEMTVENRESENVASDKSVEKDALHGTDEEVVRPESAGIKEPDGIVSDRFASNQKILNEEIAPSPEKSDLSARLTGSPIKSIVGAIGINDKFEFVNELFDGKMNLFDDCMEQLDTHTDFDAAYQFLEESQNWDMDNAYVIRILELVRRKIMLEHNER